MATPARNSPIANLQEGIYLQKAMPPPAAWRALFLEIAAGTAPPDASAALEAVMAMLAELQAGRPRDLAGELDERAVRTAPISTDTFAVLVGFGASFFDSRRHDPPLTAQPRPRRLVPLRRPPASAFPSLPWDAAAGADGEPSGEADLALQYTAASEHAAARAAVETWKLIEAERLPLAVSGCFPGFQRDDGRSWIGFHDGVTNIEPSQRLAAVECRGDPEWNRGGTYLAFLRVQVDLREWGALSSAEQEIVVGRDKLTGCPLASIERAATGLRPRPIADAPPAPAADWRERDAHFNPPETVEPLLEASHVHRANQARAAGGTPGGERIFRQGYEYLDRIGPAGPTLGLNFVSFQNDIERLQQILGLEGWLGDVNFGGPAAPAPGEPQPPRLLSLRAGGFYAVPPRAAPFPGATLFEPV